MRLHSCRCSYNVVVFFGILLLSKPRHGKCNPITNSHLNEDIREFAPKEDSINSTNVRTLQKEDPKRYTDIVSFRPITFKDVPDSKQSSSSYGRGLVSRDHPGYALHDYEEYPHINYGYDYHLPDSHHHGFDHHDFNPHHGYYDGHHVGHHRYYNHALAAKAVLWPIAGIALLGAAAALVSNPILLQLGVTSGKRRRRNTEEITGPELSTEITEWRPLINRKVAAIKTGTHSKPAKTKLVHRKAKRNEYTSTTQRINPIKTSMTDLDIKGANSPFEDEGSDEFNFIPISIITKDD
ncbi:uncharacterized protein LOC123873439 [Maniola jurtina]|uniref:uncharacterized protein LOC123873439 n=1 Tax=Maniola jurtina TaxID=191418 RepID=UPI001E68B103|nr:uncharacterized protein LOC123873439 [Maniola jurtina]